LTQNIGKNLGENKMCLKNLVPKKELAEFKRNLPKEFDVFKVVQVDGSPQWWSDGEDTLKKKGIHKAQREVGLSRMSSYRYEPGFHAFLTRHAAQKYKAGTWNKKTKKFRAKRIWVTAKGITYDDYGGISCIVLSKIEVI